MFSDADTARIFVYQPTIAAILLVGALLYTIVKVRSATDLRDRRLVLEAELGQKRQTSMLAGRAEQDREQLDAMEAELADLRVRERRERELFGFGEDTPTSRRTAFGFRLPPTDISRKFADKVKEENEATVASDADDGLATIAVIIGTPLLFLFLLYISG